MSAYDFETLDVQGPVEGVLEVCLNRPKRLNAMNNQFWSDLRDCFRKCDRDTSVRCVVLTGGSSRIFTCGLDLQEAMTMGMQNAAQDNDDNPPDVARKSLKMLDAITLPQEAVSAVELCKKPVIIALHNAVIGGGIDLACACDIRYCSSDAFFSIAEVLVGLAADVGTLQRLPKIVGNDSVVRELALTGRRMDAQEAEKLGLVGKILPSKEECWKAARETAKVIAANSPVAVSGTKISLNYSRDHSTQEGLDHIRIWNMTMLQSDDMKQAALAQMQKEKAKFSNL